MLPMGILTRTAGSVRVKELTLFCYFLAQMHRHRCPRPQHECTTIEYQLNETQLSFLLSPSSIDHATTNQGVRPRPTLFTFPSDATLQLILSRDDFIRLAAQQLSVSESAATTKMPAHFELEGQKLDESLQFSSILSKESVVLVINDDIRLELHKSQPLEPDPVALDEHQQQMPARLPIDEGLRPASAQRNVYPNNSLDLLFDTYQGQIGYLFQYLQSHFGERHEFTVYPIQRQKQQHSVARQWEEWETGIYKMRGDANGTVNIAVASDWGAGTLEAALVASAMVNGADLSVPQKQATPDLPHYTVHLGDIYYVGLPSEVQYCCLGMTPPWAQRGVRWPIGQHGSFTIPGNHELYSRGFGYWDYFLPHLGLFDPKDLTKPVHPQTTSYWLLENEQWRMIGLDTGYDSYSLLFVDNSSIRLPDELMNWLKDVVGLHPQMTDKRGLIFFSHHQIISAWDEEPYTDFPEQIASLLPEGRTVLYLWGHEHRLSFYEKQSTQPATSTGKKLTFYGRCVGNSGFPTLATELPTKARETQLLFYDDRLFSIQGSTPWSNMGLGFNGYVTMKFVQPKQPNDPSLFMTYKSLKLDDKGNLTAKNPTALVNEEWAVDVDGNVTLVKLEPLTDEITDNVHVQVNNLQSLFKANASGCCTTL